MSTKTKITFYGQSMFVIESEKGIKIGTDPFDSHVKSNLPDVSANIVTVSHSHFDHSNVSLFKGNPEIIREAGVFNISGIPLKGYQSFHDNKNGTLRGKNIIFSFEIDKIKFVHFGDYGSVSNISTLNELKNSDIIFIPAGGVYTINYKEATSLIKELNPKIAIPMHFKEKDTRIDIDDINSFKNNVKSIYNIKEFNFSFSISKEEIPKSTEIWIIYSS
ncbi:MAG: MBL fold metallo-hydrolase [Actinobacteria bacterium]|nr:MBL fold metallo-hydrolase [Actinomycetota bacterium]